MNSLKRISCRYFRHETKIRSQLMMSTSADNIQLPVRKERGPTDILKALESTISKDPTAAHYKYHDDPFLTPLSKLHQRTYAMSREAGRKAAMWIHKEHADLFPRDLSDPAIKAFQPPIKYDDKSKVSEEVLLDIITQGNVPDALQAYEVLEGNVSNDTKQALLELLCFFNKDYGLNENLIEEEWHKHSPNRNSNVWKQHPVLNSLFEDLKKQSDPAVVAAAYNALICGLSRHQNAQKAWSLYKKCQEKGIPLYRESYNHLIQLVPILMEGDVMPLKHVRMLCSSMVNDGINPDEGTLNAALAIVRVIPSIPMAIGFLKTIFNEFKAHNLKPSLGTYYHALRVLRRQGDDSHPLFVDTLKLLKGQTFDIQNKSDLKFFTTAMDLASSVYVDRTSGEMVHDLLLTGDNYKFLANGFAENIYFRQYLSLILATSTIDEFYTYYEKIVPNIYIPEPILVKDILVALQSASTIFVQKYLPRMWSDIIIFNHLDVEYVVKEAVTLMESRCALSPDSPLHDTFAEAATTIWNHTQELQSTRLQSHFMKAQMLGSMAVLLSRGNRLDQMMEIIDYALKSKTGQKVVVGVISTKHIHEIFEKLVTEGFAMEALAVIEYYIQHELDEAQKMAKKLHQSGCLSPAETDRLINLVGQEALELQPVEAESV